MKYKVIIGTILLFKTVIQMPQLVLNVFAIEKNVDFLAFNFVLNFIFSCLSSANSLVTKQCSKISECNVINKSVLFLILLREQRQVLVCPCSIRTKLSVGASTSRVFSAKMFRSSTFSKTFLRNYNPIRKKDP